MPRCHVNVTRLALMWTLSTVFLSMICPISSRLRNLSSSPFSTFLTARMTLSCLCVPRSGVLIITARLPSTTLGELLFFPLTDSSGDFKASRGFWETLMLVVLVRPWPSATGEEALDRDNLLMSENKCLPMIVTESIHLIVFKIKLFISKVTKTLVNLDNKTNI